MLLDLLLSIFNGNIIIVKIYNRCVLKKILMFSLLSIASLNSFALEFQVRIPLDNSIANSGGVNPNDPNWETVDFSYGPTIKVGSPYSCLEWQPPVDQISVGTNFTQHGFGCSQKYERSVTEIQYNAQTDQTREIKRPNESMINTDDSDTRSMIGTQEGWVMADPLVGEWGNVFAGEGSVPYYTYTNGEYPFDCKNELPAPETQVEGIYYNSISDCKQLEGKKTQKREQNTATLEYRNFEEPEWEVRDKDIKYTNEYAEGTLPWTSGCRAYGSGGVRYSKLYGWYKKRPTTSSSNYGFYYAEINDNFYMYPSSLNKLNFTGGGVIDFNDAQKIVYMESGKEQFESGGLIYFPGNKITSGSLEDKYEVCVKQ